MKEHGHRFGNLVISPPLAEEVRSAINECDVSVTRGAARAIRDSIIRGLQTKGWPPEVGLDPSSKISVTSIKQNVGLCLQTGNMSRMYADLLKLQALYLRGRISAAIFVLPTHQAAKKLGSNVADYKRLLREVEIFDRVITTPLLIIGFGERTER